LTNAEPGWPLTKRFDEALAYATHVHEGTFRKGTAIPYVSHLLAVCALVLEAGGTEDEAIAALLHDAVEDAGGKERLADILRRFGREVARIVEGCSDTDEDPKPPWGNRRKAYLEHLRTADASTRRVSLADKLHNARAILRDYRQLGERLWERFNAPGDDQVWYYTTLVAVFRETGSEPMVGELARVVDAIQALRPGGAGVVASGE
jgi:(p)ppGpp synthase/HD superfamily hydrolase